MNKNLLLEKPDRFLLLDVMRAFAVFMMIQGHSIDALLIPSLLQRESVSWKIWEFGRGLTAPIFLFGSGFAYVLATFQKSKNGNLPSSIYYKRLRWISTLFLIGCFMHIPAPTIERMKQMTPAMWSSFFQVDVLRLMAVSLLVLLIVFVFSKSIKRIFISSLTITITLVLITPLIYDVNWTNYFPEWIAAYMSNRTGSFFPFFPFAAYLFAGASASALYLLWKQSEQTHLLTKYYLYAGALMIIVGFVLDLQPLQLYPNYNYWKTSPNLFLFRVGCVLILWALFNISIKKVHRLPKFIPIVGQHTLSIYTAHVVFLYGCAWFNGMSYVFGKIFTPFQMGISIVLLLAGAVGLAYLLHYAKSTSIWLYRGMQLAATAGLASLIIT